MGLLDFLNTNLKIKKVSFETQMAVFDDLGFKINDGVDFDKEVANWGGKEEFEKRPYTFLYDVFGMTIGEEPWTPITNQVWNFDTEAIESQGDYVKILENIKRISAGELDFQNIKDNIDFENNKASVSFDLNGKSYTWDLRVQEDWVDKDIFSKIVKLSEEHETDGRLTYLNDTGQNLVLGWETKERFKKIRLGKAGLDIWWFRSKF